MFTGLGHDVRVVLLCYVLVMFPGLALIMRTMIRRGQESYLSPYTKQSSTYSKTSARLAIYV
jgi:hypothetical protein